MQTSKHIFITGFMGCGKTYWGQILAKKLGLPFYDLDDLIAIRSGKSIAEIFTEEGESGFRRLESQVLRSVADLPSGVVATGGGTPCYFDNMEWMNLAGTTLYLNTSPTLLAKRLRQGKKFRPLLANVMEDDLLDFITKKLEDRGEFYRQAKVVLDQIEAEEKLLEKMLAQLEVIPS